MPTYIPSYVCVCVCTCAHVRSSAMSNSLHPMDNTTHLALLSVEFPRQENWNGLPFPTPGFLPNSGIKPMYLVSLSLAGRFCTTSTIWEDGIK